MQKESNNNNNNNNPIKISRTFSNQTAETRIILLGSQPTFSLLETKIKEAFRFNENESPHHHQSLRLSYIDDEQDHVVLSSDQELAYALSNTNNANKKLLHLYIQTTDTANHHTTNNHVPSSASTDEAVKQLMEKLQQKDINIGEQRARTILARRGGVEPAFEAIVHWRHKRSHQIKDGPHDASVQQLLSKLQQKNIDIPEWRARRIIARRGGVEPAFAAILQWKQQQQSGESNKEGPGDEASVQQLMTKLQKEGIEMAQCKARRIITRRGGVDQAFEAILQRQKARNKSNKIRESDDVSDDDGGAVQELMKKLCKKDIDMAEWRARRILARHGGVEQAFEAILHRRQKFHHHHKPDFRHHHHHHHHPPPPGFPHPPYGGCGHRHCAHTAPAIPMPEEFRPLVRELEEKGFGGNERKRWRLYRLLHRFGGDAELVEAFLLGRRARRESMRRGPRGAVLGAHPWSRRRRHHHHQQCLGKFGLDQ